MAVDAGHAHPFAQAGRRFREWAAVPPGAPGAWSALLKEAFDHLRTDEAP